MATDLLMPYEKQALTANGGADGRLAVTSTANFRRGARVFLKSNNVAGVELVIDRIVSATVLEVRDPSKIGAVLFDASAYLLAQSASVEQNPQPDFYASQWLRF